MIRMSEEITRSLQKFSFGINSPLHSQWFNGFACLRWNQIYFNDLWTVRNHTCSTSCILLPTIVQSFQCVNPSRRGTQNTLADPKGVNHSHCQLSMSTSNACERVQAQPAHFPFNGLIKFSKAQLQFNTVPPQHLPLLLDCSRLIQYLHFHQLLPCRSISQ